MQNPHVNATRLTPAAREERWRPQAGRSCPLESYIDRVQLWLGSSCCWLCAAWKDFGASILAMFCQVIRHKPLRLHEDAQRRVSFQGVGCAEDPVVGCRRM